MHHKTPTLTPKPVLLLAREAGQYTILDGAAELLAATNRGDARMLAFVVGEPSPRWLYLGEQRTLTEQLVDLQEGDQVVIISTPDLADPDVQRAIWDLETPPGTAPADPARLDASLLVVTNAIPVDSGADWDDVWGAVAIFRKGGHYEALLNAINFLTQIRTVYAFELIGSLTDFDSLAHGIAVREIAQNAGKLAELEALDQELADAMSVNWPPHGTHAGMLDGN